MSNKAKLAVQLYHGKEGFNCTQAVLKTFQLELKVNEVTISRASNLARGKAENGFCGALYAALQLINNKDIQENIKSSFTLEAGSLKCKEIRAFGKLNCKECIALATEKVEKSL